jgi:dihydroorotase
MAIKLSQPLGRVAYVNARLLDPATGLDETGALLADGEVVADLGPGLFREGDGWRVPEDVRVVDCGGRCLAPGLVDIRVQLGEPGHEHKGTMASDGWAAIAGGITTFVCLPNTDPVIDDMSVLEFVARRARKAALAKVYPYAAVTRGLRGEELTEMGLLGESGAVAFTDGCMSIASAQVMRRALSYAGTFGHLIVDHPEEGSLTAEGVMNAGEVATRLGLPGIPREAEVIAVERDIRLVELTGGRLHLAHLSTADSVDAVRRAKARGVPVTCDTAPPYFALNEAAVGDYRTFAKLKPPLRSEDDRRAVVEGLGDGTIDAIASDHAPQDEESKRLPFAQAAFGGIGVDTLLAVTLELHHNGYLSLIEALRLVTSAPADLLGLPAGRLGRDLAADFIVFDPERPWQVTADLLLSKSKNSPFDGRPVQGQVVRTVIDGRTVFERGGAG